MTRKIEYVVTLLVVLLILVAGCAAQDTGPAEEEPAEPAAPAATTAPEEPTEEPAPPEEPVTLVLGCTGDVPSMDPLGATNVYIDQGAVNMYNVLIQAEQGGTGELEFELAESMEISDDGLSYTFKLKPGVKFHDGADLTARDVQYTVERMLALQKGVYKRMTAVSGAEVIDDHTVVLKLSSPFPALPYTLGSFYIVNSELLKQHETDGDWGEAYLSTHDAGSGPYQMVSRKIAVEYVMEKFPDYFEGWEGNHADRVIWRVITEDTGIQLAMEKRELDWTTINAAIWSNVEAIPDVVMNQDPAYKAWHIAFNTANEYLQDVQIRKALSLVFDYEGFVEQALGGLAVVAQGPLPPSVPCFDDSIPPSTMDIEEAKSLMAEAGYPDGGFELEMAYQGTSEQEVIIFQILQAGAAELGITINGQAMEWPAKVDLYSSQDTALDVATIMSIPGYADPDEVLYSMIHSEMIGVGYNWAFYVNPRMDEILEAGRVETDPEKRCELYREAQQIWVEDVPFTDLSVGQGTSAMQPWVKGYVYSPAHHNAPNAYDMWVEGKPAQ